jgi:hypothetical protein
VPCSNNSACLATSWVRSLSWIMITPPKMPPLLTRNKQPPLVITGKYTGSGLLVTAHTYQRNPRRLHFLPYPLIRRRFDSASLPPLNHTRP